MATISGTLKAYSGKWWPRKVIRASKAFGFVPYEITGPWVNAAPGNRDMFGVVWIKKVAVAGSGGTPITITDDSSTIVVTE